MGQQPVPTYYKWLWSSTCQRRHKIFFWLLLKDRLNTRNLLRRKNCPLDYFSCTLCDHQTEEAAQHLFWNCPLRNNVGTWSALRGLHSPRPIKRYFISKAKSTIAFSWKLLFLLPGPYGSQETTWSSVTNFQASRLGVLHLPGSLLCSSTEPSRPLSTCSLHGCPTCCNLISRQPLVPKSQLVYD